MNKQSFSANKQSLISRKLETKQSLKRLAEFVARVGIVDKKVMRLLFDYLNTAELKVFLNYLKKEIVQNNIYIWYANGLKKDIANKFKNIFKDKNLIVEKDDSLGGGIIVKIADDIINLSIKGSISQLIKSTLLYES